MTKKGKEKYVIIGASAAGTFAAAEICKLDPDSDITMISKEAVKGYYRPRLSPMLSDDKLKVDDILIKKEQWFADNKINLILNRLVKKIDPDNKAIELDNGNRIDYTKLIIASGAEVFVPPFPGRDKKGVFTLRYIEDVRKIQDYAKDCQKAAVIGGGILGLEAANGLNQMGLDVSVIERNNRILHRQLDEKGSEILEDIIDQVGIHFIKNSDTKEILGDDKVKAILLDNGEKIDADLIIISTGVRANSQVAADAGIEVNRAIVVDDHMRTNIENIYACGDCAEHKKVNFALWIEAIEQGKAAGTNAAGGNYVYENIVPFTAMNAFGTTVFSIGDVGADPDKEYDTYEEIDEHNYKKLYFHNQLISGGILIGDVSKRPILTQGFNKGASQEEMIEKIKD